MSVKISSINYLQNNQKLDQGSKKLNIPEKIPDHILINLGLEDYSIKEVPNSIYKKLRESRLNASEIKMLNELVDGGFWVPPDMSFREHNLRDLRLAKTTTNFKEYISIRRKYKEEDYQKVLAHIKELQTKKEQTVAQLQEQNEIKKPFTPITGKSQNPHTYKNINISNEILKKLLENNFDLAKKLELLFGDDFKNQAGNVDKSLNLIV